MSEITAVGATTAAAAATGASTNVDHAGAMLDRDAFLKLLVAQLKYQDPTNPADTSQMLTQSAQLTMVDRLNEMAETMETSLSNQRLSLAGTLVGREVTFLDSSGAEQTARVDSIGIDVDGLTVTAGGWQIPFDGILAVHAADDPVAAYGATVPTAATIPTVPTVPDVGTLEALGF